MSSSGGYRYGVRHTPERAAEIERWYREKLRIGTNKTKAAELGISQARLEQLLLPIRERICNESKTVHVRGPACGGDRPREENSGQE